MILRKSAGAVALIASLAVIAGCATNPKLGGDPGLQVLQAKELPAPTRVDLTASNRAYYLGPFDKLTIDVFGIPELSQRDVQVDAGGRISFPLTGVVDVAGQTPGEVEATLRQRLKASYVRDPQVTVNLKETVSQLVTIEGQVRKPGLYPVLGKLTLMRAMALAQGPDEFSRLNDIVIYRTISGQRYAALYNLQAIRHGGYPDPEVYAGDVVMVGDSPSRRLFKDLLQVVPLLTTPLIVALRK